MLLELQRPLFFPVTPFGDDMTVRPDLLREHVRQRLVFGPGGVFAPAGAGEFHALAASEVATVVASVVEATAGTISVFAGTGGPLGHAIVCARTAAESGADGLLLLPPYLADCTPTGLATYVESVVESIHLPVILYHRGRARYDLASVRRLMKDRRVVGIKDGHGDLELMRTILRIRAATGRPDFMLINGMPTAEVRDEEYRRVGISTYSSSTFTMAPTIATAFHDATSGGDEARRTAILDGFYFPLERLRRSRPGYSVALIKAGVALGGVSACPVRPPLQAVSRDDLRALRRLLSFGSELAAS
ncbi:5-dehydro-4-deoxyglucarate dehydratase [soil metagenome]